MMHLTGFARIRGLIARWIVLNIAYKLSRLAVISLCLEVSRLYYENMSIDEENNGK